MCVSKVIKLFLNPLDTILDDNALVVLVHLLTSEVVDAAVSLLLGSSLDAVDACSR